MNISIITRCIRNIYCIQICFSVEFRNNYQSLPFNKPGERADLPRVNIYRKENRIKTGLNYKGKYKIIQLLGKPLAVV